MPGLVDSGLAEWLKKEALYSSVANSALASGLLASAIESDLVSPLVTKAAADAELARQIAILGGPLALDRHVVKGQRRDLVGKCITLSSEYLGYSGGKKAFVVSADEQDDGLTILEVVRPLFVNPFPEYALALSFKVGAYWSGGSQAASLAAMSGYSYTRSGAKGEVNVLTGSDRIDDFAANVPGIVPGVGYWARGALTNALIRSQEFNDAAWFKSGLTVTANTQVAPDGSTTMDTFTRSAVVEQHYYQTAAGISRTNGVIYTHSKFAKMGTNRYLQLNMGGSFPGSFANFDLQTGAVSATNCAAYTVDCGNGIWRLVLVATANLTSGANSVFYFMVDSLAAASSAGGVGDSSTMYLWQAQDVVGNFPDGGPIIATAGSTAATGADALSHDFTLDAAQDFFMWVVVGDLGASNPASQTFLVPKDTAGSSRFQFYRGGGGTIVYCEAWSAAGFQGFAQLSGVAGGRAAIGVRWRAGKLTVFARRAGASSSGTESGVLTTPTSLDKVYVGQDHASADQLKAPLEGAFIDYGTVSDVEAAAILVAEVG